jgi:hypothetical protein
MKKLLLTSMIVTAFLFANETKAQVRFRANIHIGARPVIVQDHYYTNYRRPVIVEQPAYPDYYYANGGYYADHRYATVRDYDRGYSRGREMEHFDRDRGRSEHGRYGRGRG